ncbi:hypothetical protein MATL_G00215200, partial [Megalops atlanticus]
MLITGVKSDHTFSNALQADTNTDNEVQALILIKLNDPKMNEASHEAVALPLCHEVKVKMSWLAALDAMHLQKRCNLPFASCDNNELTLQLDTKISDFSKSFSRMSPPFSSCSLALRLARPLKCEGSWCMNKYQRYWTGECRGHSPDLLHLPLALGLYSPTSQS